MGEAMIGVILEHLARLVAFDTRNPPRAITPDGIFAYLRSALPGFTHTLTDYGAGAVTLLSTRGRPETVFNFHLDTVPVAEGWSRAPHALSVEGDRAYGLGACDIKGAAAAMLWAANTTEGDLALLFSSDEEANDPRCIAGFLATAPGMRRAIVAEPTGCSARLSHRGIISAHARFRGIAGHASERRALSDNAVHRAVRWAGHALDAANALQHASFAELSGFPFNLGRIEGGIKGNVIAPSCELRFGFRPLPSQSAAALIEMFRNMASPDELTGIELLFEGPPLPAGQGVEAERQLAAARELAQRLELPTGPAVNFWTEASLFSRAGLTALVYGPGDIAQAHTADEWVLTSELTTVAANYRRIIEHGRA
jgi:acetylornithine deacetylase